MSSPLFIVCVNKLRACMMLFFLFGIMVFCNAQNKQIDSLLTLVNTTKVDTTQVTRMCNLSKLFYENSNYENAVLYANKALLLSIKTNYKSGKARAYSRLGLALNKQNDYPKALENFEKSLLLYEELKDNDGLSVCYINIGVANDAESNYSIALYYFFKALKIIEARGNKIRIANSYNNIGLVYSKQGNYSECLKYYLKALKLREEIGDEKEISSSYNNIGIVYYDQGNYSLAMEYNQKALKIREKNGNKEYIANSYNNIGLLHYKQGDYQLAMNCYSKALKYRKEIGAKELIADSYINIALIYQKEGNYTKALESFNEELNVFRQTGSKRKELDCLHNIGNCYFLQKNYSVALSFLNQSLLLAKKIGDLKHIKSAEKAISKIYEQLHDDSKSLEHYKKYIVAKDSLFNETNAKEFAQLEAQYKFDKEQEQLASEQEKKDIVTQAAAKQKNYLITILVGISILLLLAVLIVYLLARQKALRSKYKHIELKQKLLRGQMNPHFISNALSALQYVVYKNDKEEVRNYLSKFSQLFRYIIESTREDYVLLSKEIQSLEQYLELHKLLMNDVFEYQIEVDSNLDTEAVMIPPMMAQPFIENAIKHGIPKSSAGAQIIIRFIYKSDNRLLFEVQDNGVYTAEILDLKESSKEEDHKSYATIITEERLKHLLNKKNNQKIKVNLVSAIDNSNQTKSTIASFEMPYLIT